jgi:hypothetical protein
MKAVSTFETLASTYKTTRRDNPEDLNLLATIRFNFEEHQWEWVKNSEIGRAPFQGTGPAEGSRKTKIQPIREHNICT